MMRKDEETNTSDQKKKVVVTDQEVMDFGLHNLSHVVY
jgi:hypothetical protein